jgi:hypothetical protein
MSADLHRSKPAMTMQETLRRIADRVVEDVNQAVDLAVG